MIFTKPKYSPKYIKTMSLFVCLIVSITSSFTWSYQGVESQKYQCKVISKSQAIYNAKRRIKGKIVSANLVKKGNRSVYKVRVLIDKKRVKTIIIPACK
ncbi:MAG: hypothetical protein COB38_06855 [Gammaproteobacteria bacterium]|nr:MAG: hypothetical protein COB38_06855 [Gammaproteobacteria bacterium]